MEHNGDNRIMRDTDEFDKYYLTASEELEGVKPCLMCGQRWIWMRHIYMMKKGARCICSNCSAVHIIEDGVVTVVGFKA